MYFNVKKQPGDIYTDVEIREENTTIDLGYLEKKEVVELIDELLDAASDLAESIEADDLRKELLVIYARLNDGTYNV